MRLGKTRILFIMILVKGREGTAQNIESEYYHMSTWKRDARPEQQSFELVL